MNNINIKVINIITEFILIRNVINIHNKKFLFYSEVFLKFKKLIVLRNDSIISNFITIFREIKVFISKNLLKILEILETKFKFSLKSSRSELLSINGSLVILH